MHSSGEAAWSAGEPTMAHWDVVVVGAGTAGIMAAIFAARRGARVLLLEAGEQIGGTLHIAAGMISAAGTKFQASHGIDDSPDLHYDDVMRICRGTADPTLVRLAVYHAAETFDWLMENGLKMATPRPVVGAGSHEPYLRERYAWGIEGGRSILKVVEPHLMLQIALGRVSLRLRTRAVALLRDAASGAVTAVTHRDKHGTKETSLTHNTVLATGGFGASDEMMRRFHDTPLYSAGAWPHAKGDALQLGSMAGARVWGTQYYLGNFGAVLDSYQYPSMVIARAVTSPQRRQPWEIYLDSTGRRFVDECEPSVDAREHALASLADRRFWIMFDDEVLRQAPPVINGWQTEEVRASFDGHEMFVKASTLDGLAEQTGMNPQHLAEAVASYNRCFNTTDPFGRIHRPLLISQPPFYAIRMHCTPITTNPGLATDGELRVVSEDGKPIAGFYCAGEALGAVATMGDAAVNGMMLMPALVFGRLLGERLLCWPDRENRRQPEAASLSTAAS